MIVQEANAIGTAYLRLDLLPASEQPAIRQLFRDYLDARIGAYENFVHPEAARQEFARASELQQQIWSRAVPASRADPTQESTRLLLPALNEMIDVTTSRAIALEIHLPALIFCLLIGIALLTALLGDTRCRSARAAVGCICFFRRDHFRHYLRHLRLR